jgi:dTDP-L-rhamnose 4-epimerase
LLALTTTSGVGGVFNIGSGQNRTVLSIARDLARVLDVADIAPHVLGKYRVGDIRHCFADLSRSRAELGYAPRIVFEEALEELAGWLADEVADDQIDRATAELQSRSLIA